MMMGPISRRRLMGYTAATGIAMGVGPLTSMVNGAVPMRQRPAKPVVMGHRGCSALRPEHTLGSYAKAIQDGADFVEPDLVSTKDGVLVIRHENNIAETTDVAAHSEFASRKTTKTVDGEQLTGWFTEDFTLAELKTLRAKERLEGMRKESHSYDGEFQIVTLEEMIDFVAAESAARGRIIGIIPEIKHSTYFAGIGLPQEGRFLERLKVSRYLKTAPVIVQSFETANLRLLRPLLADKPNVQLMQLIGAPDEHPADLLAKGDKRVWKDLFTPAAMADMATYADWFAPPTRMYIPLGKDGKLAAPTGLHLAARKAGMLVGTWTFRPENHFLAGDFQNGAGDGARNVEGSLAEISHYLKTLQLDGFFTDDPALGRKVVDQA
jgi:glycerophosphoryl diester phosphodiesterase